MLGRLAGGRAAAPRPPVTLLPERGEPPIATRSAGGSRLRPIGQDQHGSSGTSTSRRSLASGFVGALISADADLFGDLDQPEVARLLGGGDHGAVFREAEGVPGDFGVGE